MTLLLKGSLRYQKKKGQFFSFNVDCQVLPSYHFFIGKHFI